MSEVALVLIAAVGMLAALPQPAASDGQTAWYEAFEGPQTTWRDAGGDARYRIEQHGRLQGQAHTGTGCERLTVVGNQGTYVYISHEVGRPLVIDDLVPTVWIRSDRAGLQILARIVLPRTEDPRNGRPVSTLVRGSTYTDLGRWQQLRIDDVPRLLARQVRILRTQLGPQVDGREAYVDQVLLNVYGGPGVTNVWIDDLDIAGFVARRSGPAETAPSPGGPPLSVAGRPGGHRVELAGSVLTVEGRPFFPRIIRHQGEPLAFLKRVGFNAVWLPRLPSPEVLEEADRLGMWLVCPPPRPSGLELPDQQVAALAPIGPEYGRVLAWDLGRGLTGGQLEVTGRWAEQVRAADHRGGRPLVCLPESDLRGYSRQVDVLLLDRRPLGTSLELADYSAWIHGQPRLARPGTPIWTSVQTQPATALRQQLAALDSSRPVPLAVSSEQIRLLVYMAVAAGSRGLVFEAETPLDASDPDTRDRAMTLELLNLELQLIEPWAAAGSPAAAAEGSEPELRGNVLRANRSRLLIPIWSAPGAQFTPGQSAGNRVWLLVPGVPETNKGYQLTPGGLEPPRGQQRETGGVRITLDEFGLTGPVLFAHDPLVIRSLERRAAVMGPRAAELARNLAVHKLYTVRQVTEQVSRGSAAASHRWEMKNAPPGYRQDRQMPFQTAGQVAQWIDAAQESLRECDGRLALKEYRKAYVGARRAMRSLRLVERAYWEAATRQLPSPVSSPATVSFAALPWQEDLIDRIARSRPGPNRLPGGDFEDLRAMLSVGWSHLRFPSAGLRTAAELVAGAAHSGGSGVRLTVRPEDPNNPPAVVETPPLWITTPPVPVQAGDLVCIQGWVQVPAAITGSVDGLLVIDSLSGETLAQRIGQTNGWQQFTLYRAVPEASRVSVTFALSGLGEVWLDDVTIHCLEPARPFGAAWKAPQQRERRLMQMRAANVPLYRE
jgi:hypothetical protein